MKGDSITYNLPENWAEETVFSFDHLSELVQQLHDSAYSATVKAINRLATIRNYVIGFYIVEYEQHGNDRAKYGERLLKRLAERVNKKGINETLLKVSRAFYLNYPNVEAYLRGKSATASHQSEISPTPSDKSAEWLTNLKSMRRWYAFYYKKIANLHLLVTKFVNNLLMNWHPHFFNYFEKVSMRLGVATYQLQEVVTRTVGKQDQRKK